MTTLLELTLQQYGSIANLAEAIDVSRAPLSTALHGRRSCSVYYWRAVGGALGIPPDKLDGYLYGNERRTGGGGSLAGSIRCRT